MPGFTFAAVDQTEVGQHWGWFLALGIFMIVVGTLALGCSMTTTLFSMLVIGWLMLFAGVGEVVHAFWKKKWDGIFMHVLIGVLYVVVGFMVLANPGSSAVTLTLLMALFFIVNGIFRFILALWTRLPNWGWEGLNGVVTVILGLMIWQQWPVSGLWVIGLFIGIDLIISGWAWVMLSLAARQAGAGKQPA